MPITTGGEHDVTSCPHTDPSCPCQDEGDPCHYEGPDAMACPTLMLAQKDEDGSWWSVGMDGVLRPAGAPHCHLEGCGWNGEPVMAFDAELGELRPTGACGLLRIAPDTTLENAYEIGCGAIRRTVEYPRHDPRYADG